MKTKIIPFLFIISFFLIGCVPESGTESRRWGIYIENTSVTRVIDYEAQVVCWIATPNSISCLPIADTALPRE